MNRQKIMLFLSFLPAINILGQGYISTDYLSSSSLRDDLGNKYGSGNLMTISGRYTLPISVKQDSEGKTTAWSATLHGKFGKMENKGQARNYNPDEVLNAGITISHVRPISEKWSIMAQLGCGVYAVPDEISFNSLLANGAFVFVYNLHKNLRLGIGVALTNSFGVPMIIPMGYFNWQNSGKYEINVNMLSSGVKVSAATWLGKRVKMEAVALEMDGLSAVMKVDGKSKIYSTMMMRSYVSPSFHISKRMSVNIGVGGNWIRTINLSDRSLKGFFNSFSTDDDEPHKFRPSLRFTAGLHYRI